MDTFRVEPGPLQRALADRRVKACQYAVDHVVALHLGAPKDVILTALVQAMSCADLLMPSVWLALVAEDIAEGSPVEIAFDEPDA